MSKSFTFLSILFKCKLTKYTTVLQSCTFHLYRIINIKVYVQDIDCLSQKYSRIKNHSLTLCLVCTRWHHLHYVICPCHSFQSCQTLCVEVREGEVPPQCLSTVPEPVSMQPFTPSARMIVLVGSAPNDWFRIRLYQISSALHLKGLSVLPKATQTCMKQDLVLLRLNEAWEGAIFHQAVDFPLCHNKTWWTWSLQTLADDLSCVEI